MIADRSSEIFPLLSELDLPPSWEEAAARFLEAAGLTLVLGGTDSGKSTLCRYLIYRAYVAGEPVAMIDCDLGQSHLGPPATLGLGLYPPRRPGDDGLFPEGLYFIGQTSPVGQIVEVVVGTRRLADQARQQKMNRIVVNTSGFIQGPGAHLLKWAQVELLAPRLILALERAQELAPILIPLTRQCPTTVVRLPVSERATPKSLEYRRQYREARFARYFQGSRRYLFPLRQMAWRGLPLGQGEPLSPSQREQLGAYLPTPVLYGEQGVAKLVLIGKHFLGEREISDLGTHWGTASVCWLPAPSLEMRLVGLLDENFDVLALGLLLPSAWEKQEAAIWTPLPQERQPQVRHCRVGKLRLSLQGKELSKMNMPDWQ